MKLAPRAETLMERIALMANLVPRPLLDTQIAFTAARAIMVAAEVGLFEALGKGDQTAEASLPHAEPILRRRSISSNVSLALATLAGVTANTICRLR